MFKRPHHQRIAKVIESLNGQLLDQAGCFFAGGTAITLSLDEYRESLDIDFLCASKEGYRLLRNIITNKTLGDLCLKPLTYLREIRADRYGIRTFVSVEDIPIKLELVREDRISLTGYLHQVLNIPILSKEDMYAEKLLANADRGLDKGVKSRDIIDLAMMIDHWGDIPDISIEKVHQAYGNYVFSAFKKSVRLIQDQKYLLNCLMAAHMETELVNRIPLLLEQQMVIIENKKA